LKGDTVSIRFVDDVAVDIACKHRERWIRTLAPHGQRRHVSQMKDGPQTGS
jgi:hypothetical protein